MASGQEALDTVPHDGILSKLKQYGIYDKIWLLIYNFSTTKKGNKVLYVMVLLMWFLVYHKVQYYLTLAATQQTFQQTATVTTTDIKNKHAP